MNLFCIFKFLLGGEVVGSEGGEIIFVVGGVSVEGEEGKDEVVYYGF